MLSNEELESRIRELERAFSNIPVRLAQPSGGGGRVKIRGRLYNDLVCGGYVFLKALPDDELIQVYEGYGLPNGKFVGATWHHKEKKYIVDTEPCNPCAGEITCSDETCSIIWSGTEWLILKPCPEGCVCSLLAVQPGPGDFVGQVITGPCGTAPPDCTGYKCKWQWNSGQNLWIEFESCKKDGQIGTKCKCERPNFDGTFDGEIQEVDCVSK